MLTVRHGGTVCLCAYVMTNATSCHLTPVSPANLAERPKSAPLVDARYMEPIEDTEVAG